MIQSPERLLFSDYGTIVVSTEDTYSGVDKIRVLIDKKEVACYERLYNIESNESNKEIWHNAHIHSDNSENTAPNNTTEKECYIQIDCSELEVGEHQAIIIITDRAENKTTIQESLWIDREAPNITASLSPTSLQIGMVILRLQLQDEPAGIDIESLPNITARLDGKEYTFQIISYTQNDCDAELLITNNHPLGTATVEISGIRDTLGHTIDNKVIGNFTIKDIGGNWPLMPQNQVHSVINAYTDNVDIEHGGVWIATNAQAPVFAIEDGEIVEMVQSKKNIPGYVLIQRLRGELVWGYHHIVLGINPNTKRPWNIGDIVHAGDSLGIVSNIEGEETSYLYLELCQWDNETGWQQKLCPLDYITPINKERTFSPKILWKTEKQYKNLARTFQFRVPRNIRYQEQPIPKYKFLDFFFILYLLISIGVIYVVIVLLNKTDK